MRLFRQKDADMTQGGIAGQLIRFAIPMAIGLLFQQLYNTVDTIVVGQFVGRQALAAVGGTSSIINTLVGFSAGLALGSSVVIAQSYGAHDHKALREAVHTTVGVTFFLSLLLTALSTVLMEPLLHLMDVPQDVFGEATTYLRIYFLGMIGLLFYNIGSGILRAVGDSLRPLYFLIFSAVINTVLDLVFVINFKMGVAGVAYATIIAQALSAVLVLTVLTRDHGPYGIRWRELKISWPMCKRIFSIGLPSAIQQAVTAFSNIFVQGYINHFGSACMAAWSGYNKLELFLMIPIQSIGMASSTFVGQNFGARQIKRARDGVRWSLGLSATITLVLSCVLMIFAGTMLRLITNDPEVIAFGVRFVRQNSFFYTIWCFNEIFAGALRGTGNAKAPMFIMVGSYVVFRQIYLAIAKALGNQLPWIAFAYPIAWVVGAFVFWLAYRRSPLYRTREA